MKTSLIKTQLLQLRTQTTLVAVFASALAAALLLAANSAQAFNLLVNPSFELPPTGHNLAYGWTRFAPPTAQAFNFGNCNYWVDDAVTAHSGTFYWKEWGAAYVGTNNVAGIYQTFSSIPGSIYQAGGWLYSTNYDNLFFSFGTDCYVWLQVEFLDSSSNLLALYKSANYNSTNADASLGWIQYQVTNACDLTQPVSVGDPYFNTYAVTGAVSQLVAPLGTAAVRYRYCFLQATNEQGSSYLDDAALEQISGPIPPVITNIYPQYMIFVPPSSGVSFNVSSPSGFNINTNDIHLVLNGTDVSANLAFSGSSSNRAVFYNGLQSNTTYNVSITVTDSFNFTASANTYFETTWVGVPAYTYQWEAEDWDFSSGMYVDNPALCNACCETNCYFGQVGTQGVDESTVFYGPYHVYRPNDFEGTAISEDNSRPNLYAADRTDYCINPFNSSEWVNYTRDWPNSTNWVIGRFANGAPAFGSIGMSLVNPGVATNFLGTFTMNLGPSWSTFQFVYLQDANGNNVNVVLNGKETLQATAFGEMLPTFYMLVPAVVDLPLLSNLYPTGTHPFEPTNALSFTVTTLGATFPANGIQVILDGNDVSSALVITGSASSNNVVYPTLALNAMHTAIINVTNSLGHGISRTNQFDTFSLTNYVFMAEDYDYNGGQYINASDWYPGAYGFESGNCYVSVTNIDFHHTVLSNEGEPTDGSEYQYRYNGIPTSPTSDISEYYLYNYYFAFDYQLFWFGPADWANYTRNYPAGSYYVYARTFGLGPWLGPFTMTLGQVVSGAGTTNQVVMPLGQWSATGDNINTFDSWVRLTDGGQGAPVLVNLGGVSTLRVSTPTGDCYPNYFMLVPASGINMSVVYLQGQWLNQQLVLSWTNAGFNLQSAPAVTGTFTNVPGATSPYTNGATGAQQFFRLMQ